jgi:hypothetical protein
VGCSCHAHGRMPFLIRARHHGPVHKGLILSRVPQFKKPAEAHTSITHAFMQEECKGSVISCLHQSIMANTEVLPSQVWGRHDWHGQPASLLERGPAT